MNMAYILCTLYRDKQSFLFLLSYIFSTIKFNYLKDRRMYPQNSNDYESTRHLTIYILYISLVVLIVNWKVRIYLFCSQSVKEIKQHIAHIHIMIGIFNSVDSTTRFKLLWF